MDAVMWLNAAHCEGPDCDSWSTAPQEHGYVVIFWPNPDRSLEGGHSVYCSVDCCIRDAASRFPPKETIEFH
jgi:hypothetical protein